MSINRDASEEMRWGEVLAIYKNPRVIAMAFLGFSGGLPFLLVFLADLTVGLHRRRARRVLLDQQHDHPPAAPPGAGHLHLLLPGHDGRHRGGDVRPRRRAPPARREVTF